MTSTICSSRIPVVVVLGIGLIAAGCLTPFPINPTYSTTPNVQGTWNSNFLLTFDIEQQGNTFTWTVRERSIPGQAVISGSTFTANWTDELFTQPLSGTGIIEIAPDGNATRISFNNGCVLTRAISPVSEPTTPLPDDTTPIPGDAAVPPTDTTPVQTDSAPAPSWPNTAPNTSATL